MLPKELIIGDRFTLKEKKTSGWMTDIYTAFDADDSNEVIIKFMKSHSISTRYEHFIRYRNELSTLKDNPHNNIINIIDFGEVIGLHYVVTELYGDESLHRILEKRNIAIEEAINYTLQIAEALNHSHEHEIIHYELKPGNVLISNDTIKLNNFGFTNIKNYSSASTEDLTYNFSYISPEQSGRIKDSIDESSDLYSLGIIFYKMITGKLPFDASSISSLIHQHLTVYPKRPSLIINELDPFLDDIIFKLIAKNKSERYKSAQGLIHDLNKYKNGESNFILGLKDKSFSINFRAPQIGRDKEWIEIKEHIAKNNDFLLISGEPGSGKTRFLEEIYSWGNSKGYTLLLTENTYNDSAPMKPAADLIDSYLEVFRTYDSEKQENIRNHFTQSMKNLASLLLSINNKIDELVEIKEDSVPLDPKGEQNRFSMVLQLFFKTLSEIEDKIIILCDNIQWFNDASIVFLKELYDSDNDKISIIASGRNEFLISSSWRRFKSKKPKNNRKHIKLENLNLKETTSLIDSILRAQSSDLTSLSDYIYKRSDGNPFFTLVILKQFIDEEVILFNEDSWKINTTELKNSNINNSILETIMTRLKKLSTDEMTVLTYASIFGNRFTLDFLFKSINLNNNIIAQVIERALKLMIIEEVNSGLYSFLHDRIKEAFYNTLDDVIKEEYHLKAAEIIETLEFYDEKVFNLAYHYKQGKSYKDAIIYLTQAGEKAESNFALKEAEKYYNDSIMLIGDNYGEPEYFSIWKNAMKGLGNIYVTTGKNNEAITIFKKLTEYSFSNIEEAFFEKQISHAFFQLGDWDNCEIYGSKGLKLLGENLSQSKTSVYIRLIKELMIHLLHNFFPIIFIRKKTLKPQNNLTEILWAYLSLCWSYILSDVKKYSTSIIRGLNLSESKMGYTKERGLMTSAYGNLCAALGLFKRANDFQKRALTIRKKLNDTWGIAQSYQLLGFSLNWEGKYNESIASFKKAIEIFLSIGDQRELGMCYAGLIHNYSLTSQLNELQSNIQKYNTISKKLSDIYGISESQNYSSQILNYNNQTLEAFEAAKKSYEMTKTANLQFTHCRACIYLSRYLFIIGNHDESTIYLKEAEELYRENNFLKHYTVELFTLKAQLYLNDFIEKKNKRKLFFRKLKSVSKDAIKKTKTWSAHHGTALYIHGQIMAAGNKNKVALKYFKKSLHHFTAYNLPYQECQCRYNYAIFLTQINDNEEARKELETAYSIAKRIEATHYQKKIEVMLGFNTVNRSTIEDLLSREFDSLKKSLNEKSEFKKDSQPFIKKNLKTTMELCGASGCSIFSITENVLHIILSLGDTLSTRIYKKLFTDEIDSNVSELTILNNDRSSIMYIPFPIDGKKYFFLLSNNHMSDLFSYNSIEIVNTAIPLL